MKPGKVPANKKGSAPKPAANIQPRAAIANPSLWPIGSFEEKNFHNKRPLKEVIAIESMKALITGSL